MFAHHALGRKALNAGKVQEALEHFHQAQTLPDNLGSGLWNDVLLVPHRYYEARCLQQLGQKAKADEAIEWVLMHRQDYFTDMHLPELNCWQAAILRLQGGHEPEVRKKLAAHLRAQEKAASAIDPGYKKTTPFFISYMEDAKEERKAAIDWQRAMVYFAMDDMEKAATYAQKALQSDPTNMYATLIAMR